MLSISRLIVSLLCPFASLFAGCTITKSSGSDKRYDVKWHIRVAIINSSLDALFGTDDEDDELARLWEEGYGFSNPNADRYRHRTPAAAQKD